MNRLKLSFMSPTTARRTSSKEKNEWRTEKFNAQIGKCEKKSLYKLIVLTYLRQSYNQ